MRRLTLAALLALIPAAGWAQNGSFIRYHPPGGGGSGSGDCDPAQWSTTDGIVFGGIVGACTAGIDGSTRNQFATGAGTVPATGTAADMYIETDIKRVSFYANTDDPISLVSLYDTSTAGFGFVIDEDSMATDSATKVPTQQSVKAYVDAQTSGSFDPTTTIDFFDEMSQISVAATEQDTWSEVAFAAAAATEAPACPATGFNVGCWQIDMPTTDNGGSAYRTAQVTNATSGNWVFQARFQANATAAIGVWMGLLWHTTAGSRQPILASEGMWVRYDTDASDTNYTFQVCDAASAAGCQAAGDDTDNAVIASTVAATADAWHIARIEMDQTGVGGVPTVYMSIDGGASKTFCSSGCDDSNADMPAVSTTLYPFFACGGRDNAGTQNCYVDYVRFTGTR